MRKIIISLSCILATVSSIHAQVAKNAVSPVGWMVNTISGEVFTSIKFTNLVEGSPYYSEEWIKANIFLSEGMEFNDVLIKLDLMENKIHYKNATGQEMIASTPIRQVSFVDPETGIPTVFIYSSYLSKGGDTANSCWLKLLQAGHIGLYKQLHKSVSQTQPYNSATIEQRIRTSNRYFVNKDAVLIPVKKWSELINLLSDRKPDIDKFLNANKLKGKTESDYQDLVKFYNELPWN